MNRRLSCVLVLTAALLCGCAAKKKDDPQAAAVRANTVIYYCDGAGGGVRNPYYDGLEDAIRDVGWEGGFVVFPWNTNLGLVPDQTAPVEYKRKKAAEMAKLMKADIDQGKTVTVVSFSAGAAPAVYALEQLPEGYQVKSLIMLGSSLSQEYDLVDALRKIKDRMIVTTSDHDTVLMDLVPFTKTADCVPTSKGACAGVYGFRRPAKAEMETVLLYDKIINLPWIPIFANYGNNGTHFGVVNRQFVREVLIPIIWANMDSGRPMPKKDPKDL